jgi:hypothetical protein
MKNSYILLFPLALISIFSNFGFSSDGPPQYPAGTKVSFFGVDVKAELLNQKITYGFKTKRLDIPNGGEPLAHIMIEFNSSIFNKKPFIHDVSANIKKWKITWQALESNGWNLVLNGVKTKQFIHPGEIAWFVVGCDLNDSFKGPITQKYYANTAQARTIIGHVVVKTH